MQKEKNGREKFKKPNIRALIWKAFEIGLGYLIYVKDFCKILLFVWEPF